VSSARHKFSTRSWGNPRDAAGGVRFDAKDARKVCYCDGYRDGNEYFFIKHIRIAAIQGAVAATFRLLDEYYAHDKANAYFNGVAFIVADVASFEVLTYVHGRDRVSGYYAQPPVPGSDGRTYAVVDDRHSKDAAYGFYSGLVIQNGGSDELKTTQLPGAQAESFVSLGGGYASDSGAVYFVGKPMPGATQVLEQLSYFHAKTATRGYYAGEPVKGADAATSRVEPTDTYAALDARATYKDGRRLKGSPKP
jgi:hypothetical protein